MVKANVSLDCIFFFWDLIRDNSRQIIPGHDNREQYQS